MNFLQWTVLFCLWTFATLLAATIKTNSDPNRGIDPQQVVVIAVWVSAGLLITIWITNLLLYRAALFSLFSTVLLFTHMRLILLNLSTLESMGVSRMEEREKAVLARLHSCYEFK